MDIFRVGGDVTSCQLPKVQQEGRRGVDTTQDGGSGKLPRSKKWRRLCRDEHAFSRAAAAATVAEEDVGFD